ncbi:MAG TPA: hypothetical protein VMT35_10095 [Ignavibacteriaceae bacterium]|nr:hypothetical protein [Ignavibacteriaceae bacterium]
MRIEPDLIEKILARIDKRPCLYSSALRPRNCSETLFRNHLILLLKESLITAKPVYDEDGRIAAMVNINITELGKQYLLKNLKENRQ